jgi:hypothetical protein
MMGCWTATVMKLEGSEGDKQQYPLAELEVLHRIVSLFD